MRLAALLVAFLAACSPTPSEQPAKAAARCVLGNLGSIGGPIALSDTTGAAVTEARFAGRPALVYFGFASCPDICPTALQNAKAALSGQAGSTAPTPVLITLDPERDTAESLAAYVASDAFPEGLVGLRGTRAQIDAAAKAFRVLHRKREDAESAIGYTVDHSSFFYVMSPDWKTKALFPSDLPPEEAAACIGKALQ